MRLTVYLSDGGQLDVQKVEVESMLDLREVLEDDRPQFLTFDMDGATIVVNRDHIVRLDIETGAD
jgi:hypothetical protein